MKHITREGLKKMLDNKEDVVLLDARKKESHAKGHIPTSLNIPWREITIADRDNLIPKGKTIITYCSSFTCSASYKSSVILELLGYKVVEYDGGMDDWIDAGYQIHEGTEGHITCDC